MPQSAAEDLLEIIMRRYERASTLLTSNRPVEDWGKLLADVAAVGAMLDRLLHHGHVLKCGPKSWRTKTAAAEKTVLKKAGVVSPIRIDAGLGHCAVRLDGVGWLAATATAGQRRSL